MHLVGGGTVPVPHPVGIVTSLHDILDHQKSYILRLNISVFYGLVTKVGVIILFRKRKPSILIDKISIT